MKTKLRVFSLLSALFLLFSFVGSLSSVTAAPDSATETFPVPDIITPGELAERRYVGRVPSEEQDLYSFVFLNEDGSYTLRMFKHPVKYQDGSGKIRDISLSLAKQPDGRITQADHFVKTTFGKTLDGGIALEWQDVSLSLIPETQERVSAVLSEDEKTVSYALDRSTSYLYGLTYAGFKEDIVVSSYTGQTEYAFTLYTNGLEPVEVQGMWYLADDRGELQAAIGDVIVFTADEKNNALGALRMETVKEGEEYRMTVLLDDAYLRDEATAYPIRIDPTIEINYANSGSGAIEDVTLNSLDDSDGYSWSLYVGKRDTFGISRALMKFPGLNLSALPVADCIYSAEVEIRDLLCEGQVMCVDCHVFTGNVWSESTASWANVNANSYGINLSSKNVSYAYGLQQPDEHWYSFDILDAVKGWKTGSYYQSKGILFKAIYSVEYGNDYLWKTFSSFNRSVYQPSLTVTYSFPSILQQGVYALAKQDTASFACCNTITGNTYLTQQTFAAPPASETERYAMFKIIYRSLTNDYVIRSMTNNEVVIYADAGYNAPRSIRMQNFNDSDIPAEKAWKFTATADGFYYIFCILNGTTYYMYMPSSGNLGLTTNSASSGTKWSFKQYTGQTFRGWGQMGTWPEHIENGSSVTIEAYIYSTVIGENRAWFRNGSVDPDVATATRLSYTAQMTITPKYGGNTKIQIEANTGTAVFGYHYLMSGWDTGSFFIQNVYSSEYLSELGGLSDSELRLTGFPNGSDKEYTLWNMEYWADGYYKIVQDIVGDCIYGNNQTTSNLCGKPWGDAVWQQTLWKFIPQSDGTVKIQSQYHAINNPNNYVSLDNTTTKNIRSLANTGDKQLWIVKPLRYRIRVLYDQAFVDLHSVAGYMSVLESVFAVNPEGKTIMSNLLDRIGAHAYIEYGSTLDDTYLSYPYIQNCSLLSSSSVDHICNNEYSSMPYNCNSTSTTNQLENCQAGYHHKNGNRMLDEMQSISRVNSTSGRVLFTGFKCCNIYNGTIHTPAAFDVLGWALGGSTKCLVMANSNNLRKTAQHELVHILGGQDCGGSGASDCIMGNNQGDNYVINNMVLCESCITSIKALKYSFYQH